MEAIYLACTQEEADIKMFLHAVDATSRGATQIRIFSPDTDVLVLAVRRYPQLCTDTAFVTGRGIKERVIPLEKVYNALGEKKAAALPGFHAFTGADNTGAFSGKTKKSAFAAFDAADEDVLNAFVNLGTTPEVTQLIIDGLIKFTCNMYAPSKKSSIADIRWWLFHKKGFQSEKLPPTEAALILSIKRSHYQSYIWSSDMTAVPQELDALDYGWKLENNLYVPCTTTLPPAPDAVIELVKCGCSKTNCGTERCTCKKNSLRCTELCGCSDNDDECLNIHVSEEEDENTEFLL